MDVPGAKSMGFLGDLWVFLELDIWIFQELESIDISGARSMGFSRAKIYGYFWS